MEITKENLVKAMQTADLLRQDLMELNKYGSPMLSLLVLPEIGKAAEIKDRLSAIAGAMEGE